MSNDIYNLFTRYFDNPLMTKLKNVNDYSLYFTKLYCLLATNYRYIIVIVRDDVNEIGHTEYLSDIKWVCIQTREISERHVIKDHVYTPKKDGLMNQQIRLKELKTDCGMYECSLNILITILPKNNVFDKFDFPQTSNLINAIETFRTIITMT